MRRASAKVMIKIPNNTGISNINLRTRKLIIALG